MTNKSQLIDAIRTLLAGVGPILVYFGVEQANADRWIAIAAAIVPLLVSIVWGLVDKTDANRVLSAAQVPGVAVAVTPSAPEAVKQLARSEEPAAKDVIPVSAPPPPAGP